MQDKTKGMLLMVVCAVLWSTAGIFIKWIEWNPFVISGVRGFVSAVTVFIFMKMRGMSIKVGRDAYLTALGLGGSAILFTVANKLTTAANAIVLQYTNPIFILIIPAIFMGRKLKKSDIVTVAVIMFGIVLFFVGKLTPGTLLGNLLAIVAGVFLALMYIFAGEASDDRDMRATGILFAHLLCFAVGLPFMIICPPAAITGTEVLCILELGIFQLGLAYCIFIVASGKCSPLACSLIGALEPILNPVWVYIFDGERPGTFALIGGVIIIATVCIWCINDAKTTGKEEV